MRVCQAGPFPYQGSKAWCSCGPGGTVACTADGLVCLPGSLGDGFQGLVV